MDKTIYTINILLLVSMWLYIVVQYMRLRISPVGLMKGDLYAPFTEGTTKLYNLSLNTMYANGMIWINVGLLYVLAVQDVSYAWMLGVAQGAVFVAPLNLCYQLYRCHNAGGVRWAQKRAN